MERTQESGQAGRPDQKDLEKTSNKSDTSFEPGQKHGTAGQGVEGQPVIEHTIEALLASTEEDGRARRDTASFGEEERRRGTANFGAGPNPEANRLVDDF